MSQLARRSLPRPCLRPLTDVLVLVLAATTLCASSLQLDAIQKSQVRLAGIRARAVAAVLGFRHPIEIVIEKHADMKKEVAAYTTRVPEPADGCSLHFTLDSLVDVKTVAHEACHCALDYDVLGEYGYRSIVGPMWAGQMEGRAVRCSAWMVKNATAAWRYRVEGGMAAVPDFNVGGGDGSGGGSDNGGGRR